MKNYPVQEERIGSCECKCKSAASGHDLIRQLESYRLENKIPQEELAKKLGVAFSTVNRWMNKKSTPNKIQSYHIEKLLNTNKSSKE